MRFYDIILFVAVFNIALGIVMGFNIFSGFAVGVSLPSTYFLGLAGIATVAAGALIIPLVFSTSQAVALGLFGTGFVTMLYSLRDTLGSFTWSSGGTVISLTSITAGPISMLDAFTLILGLVGVAALIQMLTSPWRYQQ